MSGENECQKKIFPNKKEKMSMDDVNKVFKITKCETDNSLKYKPTVYYKQLKNIYDNEKVSFLGSSGIEFISLNSDNTIIYGDGETGGILAIEPDDRFLNMGLSSGGSKRKRNRKRKSIKKKQRKSRTRK